MRDTIRYGLAGLCLAVAGAWRLASTGGHVVASLGPLPDLMSTDVLTVPLAITGLALLAGRHGLARSHRVVGLAALVGAVLWVTSEWPWHDPVVPGLEWGRHGVHLLDILAIAPAAYGLAALSRWSPRRRPRRSGHPA